MKLTNIIPVLLIITLFFTNLFSETYYGDVVGNSMVWSNTPHQSFDISWEGYFSNNSSFSGNTTTSESSGDYGRYTLDISPPPPYGLNFVTITPSASGFRFEPTEKTYDNTISNPLDDFTAIDIEQPEVILTYPMDTTTPTGTTWIVNTEDSLKFFVMDNCKWVAKYRFYYSLDSGDNYVLIDTVEGVSFRERVALESDWGYPSTPYSGSVKRTVFTPTELSNEYIFKFEAIDPDGNIDTGYTNTIAVIDTVKPTVSVLVPNTGSEIWYIDSTQNITWSAADNFKVISRVISYSSDNGSNWTQLDSAVGNSGSWPWTIPTDSSTECLVKIRVYDTCNNFQEDVSDNPFTIKRAPDITAPTVTVTAPVQDESVQRGSTYDITWTATDNMGVEKIAIYLSTGSGYSKVDSMDSNPGTYSWSVLATEHLTSTIRIYAYDVAGNQGQNTSGIFKIKNIDTEPPTTTLHEPVEDQEFTSGSPVVIRTESYDNFDLAWISYYFSSDSGATYTLKDSVAHSTYNPHQSGGWRTEFSEAYDKCKVRVHVYDEDGNSVVAYSPLFKVVDKNDPTMDLTSQPDTLQSGSTYNIEWGAFDWVGVSHVLLHLSTDNGATYNKLDSISPDTSAYLWTVPQMDAPQCFLIAQSFDAAGNNTSDTSDVFTIEIPVGIEQASKVTAFDIKITEHAVKINKPTTIELYNIRGQCVFSQRFPSGTHTLPWKAQGIYILRVKRSDKCLLKKVY